MAGPPVRQRYNAKARGSVAGGSSHKKRKRGPPRADAEGDGEDATGPGESSIGAGMSSKKKKRLESYIVSYHSPPRAFKLSDRLRN